MGPPDTRRAPEAISSAICSIVLPFVSKVASGLR